MIQVNNLSKSYGGQVLFEDISFNVSRGERIGLVGRNGSGKSTLFKIILEEEVSSGGSITIPRGYRIGALSQHIHFTKPTVIEECMQVLTGDLAYADHLAEKILFGLGFSMEDLTKDPKSFSGGYQLRINLTKALVQNPDFLLLDEPTNYLDIVSLRWLKNFLVNFKGEVLLITHDREFMDGVVTHVMGITRNKIKKTAGNTHKFYELLEEEELIHEKTRLNQEKKIKHLEGFVDKFRAKASKATQAQSKLKQISKMERLDKLSNEKSLGFSFNHQKCPSKVIGDVKDLSFGYDQDNILFRDLSFQIGREDRIAIIGKNGRGKSTLLNVINSKLKMNTGEMSFHNSCQIGHFAQTNTVDLNLNNSIVNEIKSFNEALETSQVRAICGAMMF
jgi:ATP-binding cassette, subfamily F, member 3